MTVDPLCRAVELLIQKVVPSSCARGIFPLLIPNAGLTAVEARTILTHINSISSGLDTL